MEAKVASKWDKLLFRSIAVISKWGNISKRELKSRNIQKLYAHNKNTKCLKNHCTLVEFNAFWLNISYKCVGGLIQKVFH